MTNDLDITKDAVSPAPTAAQETVLEVDPREVPFMLDIAMKERDEANTRGTALKARIAFYENYIQNTVRVLKNNDIDLNELIRIDAERKPARADNGPIV